MREPRVGDNAVSLKDEKGGIITNEELEAHERRVWEAARERRKLTLEDGSYVFGANFIHAGFDDWKKEQEK